MREVLSAHAPAPRRVLELGCGNGSTASRLSELGYHVTGVEASRSAVHWASQAVPGATFLEASVYDPLAEKLGTFPVVLSLEVIEHLYDPRALGRRFLELLEPGGLGILSTPYHGYVKNLALALTGRFDAHFSPLWDHGHIKFFSRETLTSLIRGAGLTDLQIRRLGRVPPLAKTMLATFRRPPAS